MVEDLYDSEQKLSKLMEDCEKYWNHNEVNKKCLNLISFYVLLID